ncbi:MAG: endonuclease/exonuclease/phosphatase family protein [Chloroflexota bacterium]
MITGLVSKLIALLLWAYAAGLALYVGLRLAIGDGYWLLSFANNFALYYFLPLAVTLPVALAMRRRVLSGVLAAFTVLAAGWFGPRFVPGNSVVANNADAPAITVVTFNVFGDNLTVREAVDWLLTTNADVIMLQETPSQIYFREYDDLNAAYPHQLAAHPWGDTILSRHPLETEVIYDMADDGLASDVRATLLLGGQTISIYNVHMSIPLGPQQRFPAPPENPGIYMLSRYDDTQRNRQIDALLNVLADETRPYIVAGDFNMGDNTVTYGELSAVMTDTQREAGVGFGHTWPVLGARRFPEVLPTVLRIDYIWHSGDFITTDIYRGPYLGSDHLPVVATLSLSSD